MAKPTVRIALDKDTLLRLLPKGDIDAHIVFDNSVVNLLNETVHRIVNKSLFERLEKEINFLIVHTLGNWKQDDSKQLVKNAIDAIVTKLIKEKYESAVDNVTEHVEQLVRERFACIDKLITEMTTPEAVEKLMVKACAALVKGKI